MFRTLVVRVSGRQTVGQNARLFLPSLPRGKDPDLVLSVRRYSHRNVLATLESRRMLQDVWPQGEVSSHQLAARLEKEVCGVYAGFDPTASSLHVGNLLIILGLIRFQRAGHRVVCLLGGATARIGDPSGRNTERQEMSEEQLEENLAGIRKNILTIISNHQEHFCRDIGPLPEVEVVDNESWFKEMNIVTFLCTVGRKLRISRMLARHSVKSRLETSEGLSLTEFTYQAFQGFDWLHLYRTRGCRLQLGGSDQLGNIVAGQEMLGEDKEQCWGVTLPIITDEQGSKFGKSAGSPIWLDPHLTSPFQFYQFFVRQPDSAVGALLRQFTFLPEQEVAALEQGIQGGTGGSGEAQVALARAVTLLVHGQEGLSMAEKTTMVLYSQDLGTLATLTADEAVQVFSGAPYLRRLFQPGLTVIDFAMKIGCFKNERDAMRIIGAGGFYLNTVRVTNIEEVLSHGKHVMANSLTVVRVGKRNHYVVEWT